MLFSSFNVPLAGGMSPNGCHPMLFARDSLIAHSAKATVFGHLTTPHRDDVAIFICGLKDILVELGAASCMINEVILA